MAEIYTAKSTTAVTDAAVTLQLQQFWDDWHYRTLNMLGKKWTQTKAVTAALEIMVINGVSLTPDEVSKFAVMEEQQMVVELVDKLPQGMRDDFDHVALQLQMLVTTISRVMKSIDDGEAQGIQETIEDVDSTSIGQQVLKRAVVQASKEVKAIHKCQDTWMRSMEKRLDRLQRSAEVAEHAQQQLVAVETQLARFGAEQNAKSKKALLGLAESNDRSLIHTTFSNWLGMMLAARAERELREKFEKEIEDAEKALIEYREKELAGVKGVLVRNAKEGDEGLMLLCIQEWATAIKEIKREGCTKEKLKELEGKLQQFQTTQSENTKKVLARLGADQDAGLVAIAWSSWLKYSQDYKKDKEFEEQVKKAEHQLADHMKRKKDEAKTVMERMNGATDTGLMAQCIQAWAGAIVELKKAREMNDKITHTTGKFTALKNRHKGTSMNVQGRINEQIKANLLLRCISLWMLESKVGRVAKYYTNKMNHKRQQLSSVQTLFKSFAKQLEEGLGNLDGPDTKAPGDTTDRTTHTHRSKGGMNKAYGSVSLPDINPRAVHA